MMSSSEIKSLALTIEEELHYMFNDTGHKYRMKYRSLVFNIKDQKNKVISFQKFILAHIFLNENCSKEQGSKHMMELF